MQLFEHVPTRRERLAKNLILPALLLFAGSILYFVNGLSQSGSNVPAKLVASAGLPGGENYYSGVDRAMLYINGLFGWDRLASDHTARALVFALLALAIGAWIYMVLRVTPDHTLVHKWAFPVSLVLLGALPSQISWDFDGWAMAAGGVDLNVFTQVPRYEYSFLGLIEIFGLYAMFRVYREHMARARNRAVQPQAAAL
jgi:hypothetical protein